MVPFFFIEAPMCVTPSTDAENNPHGDYCSSDSAW